MDNEYISIAALNQYTYCPHRCWRMFCALEFTDNQYTIEGTSLHDRIHTLGEGHREQIWQIRAVWLKSEQYRLIGKADLIEENNGCWYPIEYKRGHRGEWDKGVFASLRPSFVFRGNDRQNYNCRVFVLHPLPSTPKRTNNPSITPKCEVNYRLCANVTPNRNNA